jgi:uncharacterized protein (DUF4415 family)
MAKQKSLTNKNGDVRELAEKDFDKGVPFSKLPARLKSKIADRKRGPQRAPTKQRITIRLSQDTLEPFRKTGTGWQTRIDAALREWLRKNSPNKHS